MNIQDEENKLIQEWILECVSNSDGRSASEEQITAYIELKIAELVASYE